MGFLLVTSHYDPRTLPSLHKAPRHLDYQATEKLGTPVVHLSSFLAISQDLPLCGVHIYNWTSNLQYWKETPEQQKDKQIQHKGRNLGMQTQDRRFSVILRDCALHWLVTVEKKEKQDSGTDESALDLNTPEIQNVYGLFSMWTGMGEFQALS